MSQWTHVVAAIRFDALRMIGLPDQKPNLGKTCSFESGSAAWDACDVPCGSEGSLQHSLWENPDRNDLPAYVATIWGDLRDYSNVQEIIDYLNRVTAGKMVRQGVASIDVEYQPLIVAHHDRDKGEWVRAMVAVEAA